ncbi:hypothetical protein [Oryza sativa Japonica Group]|uniref:Uncharacterized protein n=2 Tax=Oryza sativa subsp. japonica TaxID=39947 RepID=Q5ZC14_ORYSJ|nr:hypothetical protein [Oryza sativa Japonica Group]BAD53295.1 hypothetical protein [Oryza sativa Japonica Group]
MYLSNTQSLPPSLSLSNIPSTLFQPYGAGERCDGDGPPLLGNAMATEVLTPRHL